MEKIVYVNQNISDKNSYHSLQEAIDSLGNYNPDEEVTIEISPGLYEGQFFLERPNVTIKGMGQKPEDTEICGYLGAFDDYGDGSKRGTFRSYTLFAGADNICLENLTIANRSGEPKEKGQAIALYADGDQIRVKSCRLIGRQDTLFTGPLPPKEIKPGGFIGPRQFAPRLLSRQHYEDCYICGDVDFIFGSAAAYFDHCTIESLPHDPESPDPAKIQGYCTAASTPQGQKYGYVFKDCDFIASSLLPDGCVYLGRPWRDYAKTVFIDCSIGRHIHTDGFHDWNKPLAREESFYRVYNCRKTDGSCFEPKAPFASSLLENQALEYSSDKLMQEK